MPDRNAPVNNTPYDEQELRYFRNLLLKEHQETSKEVQRLEDSLETQNVMENDRASSQDHHTGNLGTTEEEKETLYILNEKNREKLEEINAALIRIDNGTYGICEASGKKIERGRLEAIPYARNSITKEKKEEAKNSR